LKKYIIAGVFLLGGIYFLRIITKSKLTEKKGTNAQDLISEEQGLIFKGEKCPISEETIEKQRKIREMRNKMNPLQSLMGGITYTAPQYPFEWDELCTKQQISDFKTSLLNTSNSLIEQAKKGLMPPMFSPQQTIGLAKGFGVGAGAYDPNKNYNISCGTEMCWEWDGNRWIKKV